jgi:hypothetical protein
MHVILDLVHGIYNHGDKNVWTFVRVENDTLVTGYRQTNGWGRTRTVYFAMAFSKRSRTTASNPTAIPPSTGASGGSSTRRRTSPKWPGNNCARGSTSH